MILAVTGAVLFLLPLIVTSPTMLLAQYGWWHDVETSDALERGASVMQMLNQALGVTWPNWPVQFAGTIVLLLPLARRERWRCRHFRLTYLASLLVFVTSYASSARRVCAARAQSNRHWSVSYTHLTLPTIYSV